MSVNFMEAMKSFTTRAEEANSPNIEEMMDHRFTANSVKDDSEILQIMRAMQGKLDKLEAKQTSQRKTSTTDNTINPKTGKPYRRYCWTHGCYTHWGKDCLSKATNHKDTATFKDRMGGSDKNCLPCL